MTLKGTPLDGEIIHDYQANELLVYHAKPLAKNAVHSLEARFLAYKLAGLLFPGNVPPVDTLQWRGGKPAFTLRPLMEFSEEYKLAVDVSLDPRLWREKPSSNPRSLERAAGVVGYRAFIATYNPCQKALRKMQAAGFNPNPDAAKIGLDLLNKKRPVFIELGYWGFPATGALEPGKQELAWAPPLEPGKVREHIKLPGTTQKTRESASGMLKEYERLCQPAGYGSGKGPAGGSTQTS